MSDWKPSASIDMLRERAAWLKAIRRFFEERHVLEVETPVLSAASIPDPHIESLQTRVNHQIQYLQTSPELYMKRLLAAGSGAIYQISRVFRDAEIGRLHNPEFTLVEWYQPGYSQQHLMDEVADLVIGLCELRFSMGSDSIDRNSSETIKGREQERSIESDPIEKQTISYRQLFEQATAINPLQPDWDRFNQYCEQNHLRCPVNEANWSAAMDWLLSMVIQPGMHGLLFVTDYPATQASLARLDDDNPAIARRFELFIDGIEMANGFEELTDARQQRQRFEQENRERQSRGLPAIPMDEQFLAALESGLPETAGVALGLDRLLMWKTASDNVQQAMSFAWVDSQKLD